MKNLNEATKPNAKDGLGACRQLEQCYLSSWSDALSDVSELETLQQHCRPTDFCREMLLSKSLRDTSEQRLVRRF